jgi:hypothetical protein
MYVFVHRYPSTGTHLHQHTASAVSLALSSGLHMIRSANIPSSVLPPSQDAIEEGERIHACWAVIILDRSWAAVLGEQAHLEYQQQIDTPWPLEVDDYGKVMWCCLSKFVSLRATRDLLGRRSTVTPCTNSSIASPLPAPACRQSP